MNLTTSTILLVANFAEYQSRAFEFFSFKYQFVTLALIASIVVGALCGLVGTFLVLRRLSLLGDAAGHSTLPGLAIAFLVVGSLSTGALMVGALISSFLSALAVGLFSSGPRSRPDAAIGIVLSVFFGVGIVLLSYIQRVATTSYAGLDSMLLGNVAGITTGQLVALMVTAVVLAGATLLFYRPLSLATFDPGFARSIGVPVRLVHYALLGALACSVVVSVQAVGVVLVSAMLIIPGSSALFWARRLPIVLGVSVTFGAISGMLGALISYVFEGVSTGPAMVLVASTFFILSLLLGPRQGVLATLRKSGYNGRRGGEYV